MRGHMGIVAGALWAACAVPVAWAEVVTLGSAKDNTLYEDGAGSLSNGAGQYFFAGLTVRDEKRRGLLAFDVAGGIPAGSTIHGVSLTLHMSRTIAGTTTVELRRVQADWGEGASDADDEEGGGAPAAAGDATWLHTFFPSGFWTNAGGDFATTPSASGSVGENGPYTWGSTAQLVADVQGWLDSPGTNYGWLLLGDEKTTPSAKRFDTRENPVEANRPKLTVEFTRGGDFDGDGDVDLSDFTSFQLCFGGASNPPAGTCPPGVDADLDADGDVDLADFLIFQQNFTGSR